MLKMINLLRDDKDGPGDEGANGSPDAGPESAADFGYDEDAPADQGKPPEDSKTADSKGSDATKEKSADTEKTAEGTDGGSGYGVDDPAPEESKKVEPVKPEAAPATTKVEGLDFEIKTEGLQKATAEKAVEFVKTHKLSKEQADAFLDLRRSEAAQEAAAEVKWQEEAKAAVVKQRADWTKQLRDDPEFGGQNYKNNIHQVDKLLSEHLPGVKNTLTASKGMLNPVVMKDLAKLAAALYKAPAFPQGNAPKKESEGENNPDAHLTFYE